MEELKYWVWLASILSIGSRKKLKLLEHFRNPSRLWKAKKEELMQVEGIGENSAEAILQSKHERKMVRTLEKIQKENIEMITVKDREYPLKLHQLYDKPIALFVKGDKKILKEFSMAMIGCRKNTIYGEMVARSLAKRMAQNAIVTVSGLAVGIDSFCHLGTLEGKGKTIGVIGSGFDYFYPKENQKLAERMLAEGGCLVSEYLPDEKPDKLHFVARNRVISGLVDGVVVIEAQEKSGTMLTVDFALEQGKTVFAVPGNINSVCSRGTNELIKQGAKVLTNWEDIVEEYPLKFLHEKKPFDIMSKKGRKT